MLPWYGTRCWIDRFNKPFYRWFMGQTGSGATQHLLQCPGFHVENGRGDQAALIYDSPVTDTIKTYTYSELRDEVAQFAGVLSAQGVKRATGSSSTCP
jgi:propionyl-CoA synthetase